jgi:hypothetical protein
LCDLIRFFVDGEWISEVVDDRLPLRQSDDSKNYHTEYMLTTGGDQNPMVTPLTSMPYGVSKLPEDFRDSLRKGSNALYFASCKDSNETWLPLLEKAYAKVHGDYQAIEGGFPGEGVEDLTGGIATYISSEDVLDKDKLWEELLQVNDKFLFGCGSRQGRDYDPADDEGFVRGHAYTVLEAKEIEKPKNIIDEEERQAIKAGRKYTDKKRNERLKLLKLRNPWGSQEWNGAWSDGSKEWTPDVMKELNHTFGDDGIFWISYFDFLKYYPEIDRIRLIGSEWTVIQQWTAINVPYTADYLDTSFTLKVDEEGPAVLVLSQPDDRYFQGLVGRYTYDLHFRLYKDGEETYLLRSMETAGSARSCSAELNLAPGTYTILVKVAATRYASDKTAEEVIKEYRESRREKLIAVGKSFDAVQSKGRLRAMEENDLKEEKLDEKSEDKQKKIEERDQKRKDRQRDRARRKRRVAEEKRKKDEKVKAFKEKKRIEKEAKKKEAEEKKRAADAKKKEEDAAKASESTQTEKAKEPKVEEPKVEEVAGPAKDKDAEAGTERSIEPTTPVTETTAVEDKDTSSVTTGSTGPGQPTPDSSAEPSADGKEPASPSKYSDAKEKPEAEPAAEAPDELVESTDAKEKNADAKEKNADAKEADATPEATKGADADVTTKTKETKDADSNVKADGNKEEDGDAVAKEPGHDDPVDNADEEQESCHESEDEEAVSDCSSVADSDFEWDDAIDGSGVEDSDSDDSDEDEDDMFKDDPWCARCVIGLRICTLDKSVAVGVKHGKGGPEGHEDVEECG